MENWTSIICCKINRLPLRIFLLLVFPMFNCGTGIFAIAVDQNDDDFTFKDNDIRKIQNPKINVLDQNMTGFTNVILVGSDGNDILVNSQDGDGRSQEPLVESTRQRFDRLKRYVGDIFGGWLGGSPTNLDEPESSGSAIDGLKRTRFIRQAPKDNEEYIDDDDEDETGSGFDTLEGEDSGTSIPTTMVTPLLEFTKVSPKLVSCPARQFNDLATDPRDCIDCFCFGQSIECKSSNLSVSVVQVPLRGKSDQITRIGFKSTYGEISVSSNSSDLISLQTAVEGDTLRVWNYVSTYPYLDLSQDFSGNQIKSYGGYIRFNVKHYGDSDIDSPLIIISGNGRNIFYNTTDHFVGDVQKSDFKGRQDEIRARLFHGAWFREGNGSIELPSLATREDIMRVIANVDHFFIKLQYSSSQQIDTLVSDIRIDTAGGTSLEPNRAVYVEECRCPSGYIGLSCERCDTGYRRIDGGNLGSCIAESCPAGQFGDPLRGIQCKDCPCLLSNSTNQFGRTCYLDADKKAVCDCPTGYSGRYCQFCAEGYTGDPLTPGSYCQPIECLEDEFKYGSYCASKTLRCNGVVDCDDGKDEAECGPTSTTTRAIPPVIPVVECDVAEFKCDNKCISFNQKYDKIADCRDGTDEQDCP